MVEMENVLGGSGRRQQQTSVAVNKCGKQV